MCSGMALEEQEDERAADQYHPGRCDAADFPEGPAGPGHGEADAHVAGDQPGGPGCVRGRAEGAGDVCGTADREPAVPRGIRVGPHLLQLGPAGPGDAGADGRRKAEPLPGPVQGPCGGADGDDEQRLPLSGDGLHGLLRHGAAHPAREVGRHHLVADGPGDRQGERAVHHHPEAARAAGAGTGVCGGGPGGPDGGEGRPVGPAHGAGCDHSGGRPGGAARSS